MTQQSLSSNSIDSQLEKLLVAPPTLAEWFIDTDNPKIAWAVSVLGLEFDPEWDSKKRRSQVLSKFFGDLAGDDYNLDLRRSAATRILLGNVTDNSLELKPYQDELAKEQLKQIDNLIHWFASRMGSVDPASSFRELKSQLQPFFRPGTMPAVQKAAQQVVWVAEIIETPRSVESLLVRQLLQAVFQVMATRPARINTVQLKLLAKLRKQTGQKERVAATKVLTSTYRLPIGPNLHRFFQQLCWSSEETGTTKVKLSSDSSLLRKRSESSESKNYGWVVILICSVIGVLFGMIKDSANKHSNPTSPSPNYGQEMKLRIQEILEKAKRNPDVINRQGESGLFPDSAKQNPKRLGPVAPGQNQDELSTDPSEKFRRRLEKLLDPGAVPDFNPPDIRPRSPSTDHPRNPQPRPPGSLPQRPESGGGAFGGPGNPFNRK